MRTCREPFALFAVLLVSFLASGNLSAAEPASAIPPVDYDREVRPILSNVCYKCHGPDAAERQAGLRLDDRAVALAAAESGAHAIVPGKPDESELIKRIQSSDDDVRMPPPDSNKNLTAAQKEALRRWIAEGAHYEKHWAFTTPKRPPVPAVKLRGWSRGDLDRFILARLEASGARPSAEASRAALIRRATLDLTGLPPTLAEVDAFLADGRPDAYERLVDRLLASPNYGERMAIDWLDAARFADTHGYHIDSGRDMTRWRKYVIDAFNRDLPYDRFTVEQLAGDLLPETSDPAQNLRQKIASGFNRNHMINFEGGAIAQEYLNAYIVDRVNTTGTVFLGLTVACSQCHDHKFDPLTQQEFYQLYAFFNNMPEKGLDGSQGNAAPLIKAPTVAQQLQLNQLAAEIARAEENLTSPRADIDAAQAAWELTALAERTIEWHVLDADTLTSTGGATLARLDDQSILVSGSNPAADTYIVTATAPIAKIRGLRLEALPDERLTNGGPGRSVNGNIVMTDVKMTATPAGDGAKPESPAFKSASADFSQETYPVAHAIDSDSATGWAIHPAFGKPHTAVFELASPLAQAAGDKLEVQLSFHSRFAQHQPGKFRLAVTSAANPHSTDTLPAAVADALAVATAERTPDQQAALRKYYREQVSPELASLRAKLAELKTQRTALEATAPTAMVMQELPQPRETFLLERGAYDQRGEQVFANTPAFLPPLAKDAPHDRLALANWLVDPQHPLMARVTVNRFWQAFFGTGLVKTADDFGSQGELPSHPDLLDWLAVEFSGSDAGDQPDSRRGAPWDVKRLVREIVTSATYRQSAVTTPEALAHDPENRLLGRAPRYRLPAEFIRDQALFVSGLLDRRIGGHSVSPYQPPGIWEELASRGDGAKWTAQTYSQDHGADLYRRTMYTFWKRTAPPPSLMTFDAPNRETCTVRRSRTNTPLQALVLMNDPTYVEASRLCAERVLKLGGPSLDSRLTFAFRSFLTREPTAEELAALKHLYRHQHEHFTNNVAAAGKLLAIGEYPRDAALASPDVAAWTIVISTLMNLDESITKG